ncbi:MAG: DUF4390 domain-containing protein [Burkholderiales bacterium]|nr:DUF4390 domain-containing protein [Burkholderiales bacterium]
MKLLGLLALALVLGLAQPAPAQVIEVKRFDLQRSSEDYVVNAEFAFRLTERLEEALNNGVALAFVFEFELIRPRWYWFDEKTASARLEARLSFNPLLRQYRVSVAELHRSFGSLADALASFSALRNWAVVPRDRLDANKSYVASLRLRLDTAQLPKPFQVSAITDKDLTLSSEWQRIGFTPAPPAESAQK